MQEAFKLLDQGNKNKKQADNKKNDKSSRSHTVYRVNLIIKEKNFKEVK